MVQKWSEWTTSCVQGVVVSGMACAVYAVRDVLDRRRQGWALGCVTGVQCDMLVAVVTVHTVSDNGVVVVDVAVCAAVCEWVQEGVCAVCDRREGGEDP